MVIVLIHWKIIPDKIEDFLEYWRKEAIVDNRHGLIGEFLSEPQSPTEHPWITWDIMGCEGKYKSFINIGCWSNADDFHEQIGKYFLDNASKKKDFEYEPRVRTILKPKCWRMGDTSLPVHNSGGTL